MNQTMLRQLLWICIILISNTVAHYVIQPDFDQCDRPQCDPIDQILVNNIDPNAEPCDDFFKYACSRNFTVSTAIKSGYIEMLQNKPEVQDLEDLRKILDEPFLDPPEVNINALKIEREIYKKCQREGTHTAQEQRHYDILLNTYGANRLEPGMPYDLNKKEQWAGIDMTYALLGYGFAFFDVEIAEREQGYNREPKRFIQISPTSDDILEMHTLLLTRYMTRHKRSEFGDTYSGYGHGSTHNSDKKYEELKSFIEKFNKIVPYGPSYRELRPPEPRSLSEWNNFYHTHAFDLRSKIDWTTLVQELFMKVQIHIAKDERVLVENESYFVSLAELLHATHINTIIDYIHLRFVSKTIGLVEREYASHSLIPPIEGLICTPGLLIGAAHVYTQRYFPKDNRETVEGILASVKGVVEKQLESYADRHPGSEVTRNFLNELKNSNVIIGYPDWLSNELLVSKFYGSSQFSVSDLYHRNQMRIFEILFKNKLRSYHDYGMPIFDIKTFFKSFTLENIEFSKDLKQIILPVRIFSENTYKFLSAQLFDPINYGAAGTAIATEIYSQWLEKIKYAQNATKCIRDQMPYVDMSRAGNYLLKATAYLLGTQTAYEAWPTKDSYPIQFANFGAITDFRVFFLSFAESMCRARARKDEAYPYSYLNFIVSNMREFTDAFQCFDFHKINRPHKCDPLMYQ